MSNSNQAQILRESLRLLVRRLGVLERGEASCCDITLSQCHTIVEIGRAGTMSLNTLAETLGLDKSTVSRSVDKLVSDGIIVREADAEDRRYLNLRLSEKGQSLFQEVEKRMAVYFAEVIAAIPADKREQVTESLQFLAQALKGPRCC
ncbi:MAG: MarR family transcriptional regulator [Negativicutes bacterium]|nr:MarR family transcriptional regulator [Negativicutes bacterium]